MSMDSYVNMIMDTWQLPSLFPGATLSFLNTESQFAQILLSALEQSSAGALSQTAMAGLESAGPIGHRAVSQASSPEAIGSSPTKKQIVEMADYTARKYGVNPKLVRSVIGAESGYDPQAVSHAGAEGLMQLMPQTARDLGVENPMNPSENIDGGVRYLKQMLERYHGNVSLALAAYNAGPAAVDRAGGIPDYRETQSYVREVLDHTLDEIV